VLFVFEVMLVALSRTRVQSAFEEAHPDGQEQNKNE